MLFISYSRINRDIAEKLQRQLLNAGFAAHQVFKDNDPRNGIPLGKDWEQELLANIKGVTVLIVLVSPAWFESKWCFAELAMCKASRHEVRIIPFVVEDLTAKKWLKSGLSSSQKSNVSFESFATHEEVIAAFIEDLGQRGIRPESSPGRLVNSYPDAHSYRHQTFDSWAKDPNLQQPLVDDENQQKTIAEIHSQLLGGDNEPVSHLHIHGQSGVGKTRLVLSALDDERFRSKVLYYESPESYLLDPYIRRLLQTEASDCAILVIDDCLRANPNDLAKRVERIKERVKVITISFAIPTEERKNHIELFPIDSKGIQQIIKSYLPTEKMDVTGLAMQCQGSARYAHLIGKAAKDDQSILDISDGRDLVERIIPCGAPKDSEIARTRLTVARFLSLFERFGIASPYGQEIRDISKAIRRFHPNLGIGDVLEAIQSLHQARILQGKVTYYFATSLMAYELWASWWSIYGEQWTGMKPTGLSEDLFETWIQQFTMVPAGSITNRAGSRIVQWLSEHSHSIVVGDSVRRTGATTNAGKYEPQRLQRLLYAVFDLAPKQSLELLTHSLRPFSSEDQKYSVRTGLQSFEYAIRKQARRPDLAIEAIELLWEIELGKEIEGNDSNVAHSLGNLMAWKVTDERTPELFDRFVKFLKSKSSAGSNHQRTVSLVVLYHAINETDNRTVDAGKYVDSLWKIGSAGLKPLTNAPEARPVFKLFAACLQEFFSFLEFADSWAQEIAWIAETSLETRKPFLAVIESIWLHPLLHFQEERARNAIKQAYHLLMAGGEESATETVLLTDTRSLSPEDEQKLELLFPRKDVIQKICADVVASPASFENLIEKMIVSRVSQYSVGVSLANLDTDRAAFRFILSVIAGNLESASNSLLLGYISGVRKLNKENSQVLAQEILALDWPTQSRLDLSAYLDMPVEEIEMELIATAKDQNAHRRELLCLSNDQILAMSELRILEAIEEFTKHNTIAPLQSAAWLFHSRFKSEAQLSQGARETLRNIVLSKALFESDEKIPRGDINMYFWDQCFEIQARVASDVCVEFVSKYWTHYVNAPFWPSHAVADTISDAAERTFDLAADLSWNVFFTRLDGCETKAQQLRLIEWLSREDAGEIEPQTGSWGIVPFDRLCHWAEVDPDVRLALIASRIPPLFLAGSMVTVTLDFLLLYGEQFPEFEEQLRRRQFGYSVPSVGQIQTALTTTTEHIDLAASPKLTAILEREIEHLTSLLERTKDREETVGERRPRRRRI